jgi:Flp pilus assembly protein TadB
MRLLAALAVGTFCALLAAALAGVLPAGPPRRSSRERRSLRRDRTQLWLQQAGAGDTPRQLVAASAGAGLLALLVLTLLTGSLFVAVVPAAALALTPARLLRSPSDHALARGAR